MDPSKVFCHEIDRFFPSSKRCHVCGYINNFLTLSDRRWQCPECKTDHDRDFNAEMNILIFGRAGTVQTSLDTKQNACGEAVQLDPSLKQEALSERFVQRGS